ncbi:MAG: adenosine kinase [Armatimonadota bacterium]|nr:MAG: adenosine kinase [Armatimonadota bacterium]
MSVPQKVLIVGSVGLDDVTTPYGSVERVLGGAASYSSVAASFFAPVAMVAVVGQDFPQSERELFASRGIDLSAMEERPGATFRWAGEYGEDPNQAITKMTELNVFAGFDPVLPETHRQIPFVFLANIDPSLQRQVLDQMSAPAFTACDTMNFWITGKRDELIEVLKRVDLVLLNDAEARMLTGRKLLVDAADDLLALGPSWVAIKKGEHGALLFGEGLHFSAPSYPLRRIVDPTGAGDCFAGALVGYLARTGDLSRDNLRRAVVYGCTVASFNVEDFSLRRLCALTADEIEQRFRELQEIARF